MPRPLRKTAATSLKMTPEVRDLWEQCAAAESRSLTNMFEVLVRDRAKSLNLQPRMAATRTPAARKATAKK
jgi:hypothetical protein